MEVIGGLGRRTLKGELQERTESISRSEVGEEEDDRWGAGTLLGLPPRIRMTNGLRRSISFRGGSLVAIRWERIR